MDKYILQFRGKAETDGGKWKRVGDVTADAGDEKQTRDFLQSEAIVEKSEVIGEKSEAIVEKSEAVVEKSEAIVEKSEGIVEKSARAICWCHIYI